MVKKCLFQTSAGTLVSSPVLFCSFPQYLQANTRKVPRLEKGLCRRANLYFLRYVGSFVAPEASRATLKLIRECQQAVCVLANWNEVTFLWVLGHSGIQGNENADAVNFTVLNQPYKEACWWLMKHFKH
jgi:hypothetical protein